MNWLLACLLFSFLVLGEPFKILMVAPFPAPSHFLWLSHFNTALLERGHHVTAITSNRAKFKHHNYSEIVVDPAYDASKDFPSHDIFDLKYSTDLQNLFLYWRVGLPTTEHALKDPRVQKFIAHEDSFDLVISEQFFQEAMLTFAFKFKCPVVTIGTLGFANHMDRAMGFSTPLSFVGHSILPYSSDLNFFQRFWNVVLAALDHLIREWYYLPKQNDMARKYFAPLKRHEKYIPSVQELERNISLMLINSHIATNPSPRPLMPSMIGVGGAHIKPPKALPQDIQEFLDGARHGAVIFSLGSIVQSNEMSIGKLKIFAQVFKSMKQRVLMKFHGDLLSVSPNVKMVEWLPQADVLAHPNVVLFITHGGVFGFQEALAHGVPMLFIPFYGDQWKNAKIAESEGYALRIRFTDLCVTGLRSKINELISNPAYKERALEVSQVFTDNVVPPMDQAVYWIEYVARHRGAPFLKSASVKLHWFKYLLLDVILVQLAIVYVSWLALRSLYRSDLLSGFKKKLKLL